jgi:hypothetical protein
MTTDRRQVLSVTRRKLASRLWLLALAGGTFATASEVIIIGPGWAQGISAEELTNPGPLPDEVLG